MSVERLSMWMIAGSSGLRAQGRMMSLHSALRAQLGVAVPAMALPEDTAVDAEPVLLFFGIVDFLQVPAACAQNLLQTGLALMLA